MFIKLISIGAIIASLGTASISTNSTNDLNSEISNSSVSAMKWEQTEINLGEIEQGKPVDIKFTVTNEGTSPIIISDVKAGCGCTSVKFDKEPLRFGESADITAIYNAKASGSFTKSIKVYSNVNDEPTILKFSGIVD